ncbi:YkgJ family cysteine cluster protein [Candidatus Bathyarchaeota archaeon]|nr:YkgJ family cysteine cluster protein [Candidatus Bathyarchaeota archaeon]
MSGDAAEFRCLRCGKCCASLLFEDRGVLRGLTLLSDEVGVFPVEHVKPAVGVGKRPHGDRFTVVAYQFTGDTCLHLHGARCAVYNDRPSSCRQYPFSLEPSRDGDPLMGFDLNCPSVTRLLDENLPVVFEGREAAERLLHIKTLVSENPRRAWFYDLRKDKWVRGDRLS